MSFWGNFLSNALATLLGVFMGIPIGLWVNRMLISSSMEKKREDLIRVLQETVEKNLNLVNQMSREISPHFTITYNVDTTLLESTASIKYEIINNLELNRTLDTVRYELLHLYRQVDILLDLTSRYSTGHDKYAEQIVKTIRAHLPIVLHELQKASSLIKKEMEKYRSKLPPPLPWVKDC